MRLDRRRLLSHFIHGGLGLRALATGLPAALIARGARAQTLPEGDALYTVLALTDTGDPLNANVPGSYVEGVVNNPIAQVGPVDFQLGGRPARGARPWAELPEALRERFAFLHVRSNVVTHNQLDEVMSMHGAINGTGGARTEVIPSMIAKELAPRLGTVLSEPVPLGREPLSAEGLPLNRLSPAELKNLFSTPAPGLERLSEQRDAALDALYAELRQNGTRQQRQFLDRYAIGRSQARLLGEQLSELLSAVSDNPLTPEARARDEIRAAVALFRLNVTPVVTIHLAFGGDNHQDTNLTDEAETLESGTSLIRGLWDDLRAAGLEDRTHFSTFGVFGRTHGLNQSGGRDHNGGHLAIAAFGPKVRPGVYGGLSRDRGALAASAIDPATGFASEGGAVRGEDTLLSAGRTLGRWAGLSEEVLDRRLPAGRTLEGAIQ